jgi:hypothetical protein
MEAMQSGIDIKSNMYERRRKQDKLSARDEKKQRNIHSRTSSDSHTHRALPSGEALVRQLRADSNLHSVAFANDELTMVSSSTPFSARNGVPSMAAGNPLTCAFPINWSLPRRLRQIRTSTTPSTTFSLASTTVSAT